MNRREFHHLLTGIGILLLVLASIVTINQPAVAMKLGYWLPGLDLWQDHALSNTQFFGQIGGFNRAVRVVNDRAYVSEGGRVVVLDISEVSRPTAIGQSELFADLIYDIAVADNLAYVATGFVGLQILDLSDPTNPTVLATHDTPGSALRVQIMGTVAYVADDSGGLRIINIADPQAPKEVGVYTAITQVRAVKIVEAVAYVAHSAGLSILDINDPTAPTEIALFPADRPAASIDVVDTVAYLGVRQRGLYAVNVSDRRNPARLGYYESFGEAAYVRVQGTIAYLADGYRGVRLVDVADPSTPTEIGVYFADGINNPHNLDVQDQNIFIANGSAGLEIVDKAVSPQLVGRYDTMGNVQAVTTTNANLAYIADGTNGLKIVDVADPANPIRLGSLDTPGNAYDVAVNGSIAYVADGIGGLRVIDVSNPAAPVERTVYPANRSFTAVQVVGSLLYLLDGGTEMQILSIFTPTNPQPNGSFTTSAYAYDLHVVGATAYLAAGSSGLQLINVSNPSNPTAITFYDTPGSARALTVVNATAYIADGFNGVQIVNVANPNSPNGVGLFDTSGYAYDVKVSGDHAYVADGYNGLRVIDVSTPNNPIEVGFYDTQGLATGLFMRGNLAYVASDFGGLWTMQSPPCYRLQLSHTGSGSDPVATPANSTNCRSGEYSFGELISLSAAPATNWQIAGWIGTRNDSTSSRNNTVTMPAADHEVLVNYVSCQPLTLNHSGSGAVPIATPANSTGCPVGQYVFGDLISLTAAPAADWRVSSWIGSSNDTTSSANNLVTMPATAHEVIVNYRTTCYSLTLAHSGNGTSPITTPANSATCPPGQFIAGDPVSLYAAPAQGWRVASWAGATASSQSTDNRLTMPRRAHSVSVTYAAIPQNPESDAYENDNDCTTAQQINVDGVGQERSFHQPGDQDWVQFAVTADVRHRIEVNIPDGSPTDVALTVYGVCSGTVVDQFNASFAPGIRLDITPTVSSTLYLHLTNEDETVGGPEYTYQLSVRPIQSVRSAINRNQAVIIVGGSYNNPDQLQSNINYVTNSAYAHFRAAGYNAEEITYLSNDTNIPNRNGTATRAALKSAITEWAPQQLTVGGTLILYLMDHGDPDKFYLDNSNGEVLTPEALDSWLDQAEALIPEIKVTVIIEACYSGSFIKGEQSISQGEPGRLVVTSTSETLLAYASNNGAYFSDFVIGSLQQGYSLHNGFKASYAAVRELSARRQEPWIDANGNGIPNEPADITLSTQAVPDNNNVSFAPYIVNAAGPTAIDERQGTIQAVVRDDKAVRRVWAVITPPSYQRPDQSSELVPETLPTIVLTAQGDDRYAADYTGFSELGTYRIAIYAEDEENLVTLPKVVTVSTGSRILLPVIVR